ncbi:AbiJ-NTD4 domain-containing protein [Vreelandella sulfidaeris]
MRKFSERVGLVSNAEIIQRSSMNNELRNSLWNVIYLYFITNGGDYRSAYKDKQYNDFFVSYYVDFLKQPIDTLSDYSFQEVSKYRDNFFRCAWFEVYENLEFLYSWCVERTSYGEDLKYNFNLVLEKESSAYRFVGDILSEIISEEEINEVEKALSKENKYSSIKEHLSQALILMSDRKSPDYRNSGKESISSIEALVKVVTGKSGTLGQLIKELEREKMIPPTLKTVYSTLYGYTCEEDGIRHALNEVSKFEYPEARYMLIVCSAFVNYVIEVYEQKSLEVASS